MEPHWRQAGLLTRRLKVRVRQSGDSGRPSSSVKTHPFVAMPDSLSHRPCQLRWARSTVTVRGSMATARQLDSVFSGHARSRPSGPS